MAAIHTAEPGPAARLMVVGAHEDRSVMAMRWREGADRVLANGSRVRCAECRFIGVEDLYHWDRGRLCNRLDQAGAGFGRNGASVRLPWILS